MSRFSSTCWQCVEADDHAAECNGGSHRDFLARHEHAAALLDGTTVRARGTNPHHRTFSFESSHFIAVIAPLLDEDINLRKRGAALASVQSLKGLLQAYMLQPVTTMR